MIAGILMSQENTSRGGYMIKSIGYSQDEMIKDILKLHCNGGDIICDPTYSRGNFYKKLSRPKYTFDIEPQDSLTIKADCRKLPLQDDEIQTLMFDPPFVISSGPSLKNDVQGQNIIHKRFSGFPSPKALWDFYKESLDEFYRILKSDGTLIFKCQDTVSSGKNYLSHVEIINYAQKIGFYTKDLFILAAKTRLLSGKIKKQQHCRKFHCYFIIFKKKKSKVIYS